MKILNTIGKSFTRIVYLGILFIYFCYKVIISGWLLGWQIIKGYRGENEEIIEYQINYKNPWHIILIFNLISMTPGSLSTDISDESDIILVHLLNKNDKEDFIKTTRQIEKLTQKVFS
ncbi:MAG TPA: Na+/H+ antiporter subunit E [Bacteroidales bacterium]|nr:Na+/H+ antiporter subunit E [Bacteroidales bacterium]